MGDRSRRNHLVLNSVCEEKWVARCQEMHQERLHHMKSRVDTSEPPSVRMAHLNAHANPKRLEQKAERQRNIDKDNRVLLEKMLKINSIDSQQAIRPFLARTTFRWGHGQYFDPINGTRCLDHINPNVCPLPSLSGSASAYSSMPSSPSPSSWHSSSGSRGPGSPHRPHSGGSFRESTLMLRAMNLETRSTSGAPQQQQVHGQNHVIQLSTLHGPHGPGSPYVSPKRHSTPNKTSSCRSMSPRSASPSPLSGASSAPSTPVSRSRTAAALPSPLAASRAGTPLSPSLYSPGRRPF